MSRLPQISGSNLAKAFFKDGWYKVSIKGSHLKVRKKGIEERNFGRNFERCGSERRETEELTLICDIISIVMSRILVNLVVCCASQVRVGRFDLVA